ncbi:MAG: UDP-N-acetylmuramoyl-tripeptide--D-alanyl-D-alanine ligase [Acetivibrionales bacterium]|jgi:UDP-N-acetylmuramoyl-tripeptide--D-alanyl-D-alanine ligase
MFQIMLDEIIEAIGGKYTGDAGGAVITGVSTDSRTIRPGDIFIPLIGENFDGHDFIGDAFEKGAAASLTHRKSVNFPGKTVILVNDTLKALQDLAACYRKSFDIPFIGVTGSVGKTSTKEMVACAIGARYNVLKNEGNLNNEIGVPLTMFRLDGSHEAAVVEMGMSAPGEIRVLSAIVRPRVGIITNIGMSHIEKMGSRSNILKAKLEILEGLQPGGLLVLNGDDIMLSGAQSLLDCRTVTYGLGEGVDYMAYNIRSYGENGVKFDIMDEGVEYCIHVPAPGIHNVYNALAAIAAGRELGVPVKELASGIACYRPGEMRLNIIKTGGFTVINDAYNASPHSVKAALEVLGELAAERKIAVLGDMLELGEWSSSAHKETGGYAAGKKLDYIVTVGRRALDIAGGAVEAGFAPEKTASFMSNAEALDYLKRVIRPGDAILVKGSRGMKMEEIVLALTGEER